MSRRFTLYRQRGLVDCGPACLRMIARHHGRSLPLAHLRRLCDPDAAGTTLLDLGRAAEAIGFRTMAVAVDYETLHGKLPLPCIAFLDRRHYVVAHEATGRGVRIADPSRGEAEVGRDEFLLRWGAHGEGGKGVVLLLEPTPRLHEQPLPPGPATRGVLRAAAHAAARLVRRLLRKA